MPLELDAGPQEALESLHRAPDPFFGVRRKAVGNDQSLDVPGRRLAELDARQPLQAVERDGLTVTALLASELDTFEGAGYPGEQIRHGSTVDVCLVDRPRKKRSGERALLQMRLVREPAQLRSLLRIERDVEPNSPFALSHIRKVARSGTTRVRSGPGLSVKLAVRVRRADLLPRGRRRAPWRAEAVPRAALARDRRRLGPAGLAPGDRRERLARGRPGPRRQSLTQRGSRSALPLERRGPARPAGARGAPRRPPPRRAGVRCRRR